MRCGRCDRDNPAGAKFCNGCGARVAAACPACGHVNPPESRFCNECGAPLSPGAAPPAPQFASPEAYTPGHLAQKILSSSQALAGERKLVTVLFADMKGSLELLADRDPEEARRLLDPVIERMMAAVHRFEGTVNQVMGDGIMALFGAPVAHEDHAVRACYAALDMQREIQRYTEDSRRRHGIEVQIRVGLNSGEVVVRAIGSDLRMDYSAVGVTTHLAARMEQLAPPSTIRLTAATLALADGRIEVRALGPVPVKGIAEPVDVFELIAAARGRTRLQAAAARGLTRFVGRDDEMARLRQALEEARAGQGRVVAAVGEAGVGKSRLFHEFVHSHRTDGCLVLESSSVAYGRATAYLAVVDLLRGYFNIEAGDDPRTVREKATGKVLALDESLRSALPVFLALLEVPAPDDDGWERLDPGQRRHRAVAAVKRILLRESQVRPVVVMFEDLHWLDTDSQAVLDGLLDGVPAARMLLLVNYRPEYRHDWGSKTFYGQIRLDPLAPESAEGLLAALLGADSGLEPLRRLLVARTEGNPFFLEECVRTLAETGVLDGAPGAYRLSRSVEGIDVPATVQAVVAARIDRLAPEDKALVQTAAVIGRDVPFGLLRGVAGLPEDALRSALARLLAAEFLYEVAIFPEPEYTFKHALTHEIAYGGLLHERRRDLHARIVRAFEAEAPARVAERAPWLAQHAFRGELWGKAAAYLRSAPAAPDTLEAVGGPESAGQLWWLGEHERALTVAQRDLAIGGGFRNFWMQVVGRLRLGQTYHSLGDHAQAIQHLERNVAVLSGELVGERPRIWQDCPRCCPWRGSRCAWPSRGGSPTAWSGGARRCASPSPSGSPIASPMPAWGSARCTSARKTSRRPSRSSSARWPWCDWTTSPLSSRPPRRRSPPPMREWDGTPRRSRSRKRRSSRRRR